MISKVLRRGDYFIPIEHIISVFEELVTIKATAFPVKITTLDLDKDIEFCFDSSEKAHNFKKDLLAEIDEFYGLC